MCRYKRQEEHPYLLTLAKALRGKEQHRNGRDGRRGDRGSLGPAGLEETKTEELEGRGGTTWAPGAVQRGASARWAEPRLRGHYLSRLPHLAPEEEEMGRRNSGRVSQGISPSLGVKG